MNQIGPRQNAGGSNTGSGYWWREYWSCSQSYAGTFQDQPLWVGGMSTWDQYSTLPLIMSPGISTLQPQLAVPVEPISKGSQ